jgi:hypothetical protein
LESQPHLIEVRCIAPLQYKADVRVRNEIAVPRYGISVTIGSDS